MVHSPKLDTFFVPMVKNVADDKIYQHMSSTLCPVAIWCSRPHLRSKYVSKFQKNSRQLCLIKTPPPSTDSVDKDAYITGILTVHKTNIAEVVLDSLPSLSLTLRLSRNKVLTALISTFRGMDK